MINERPSVMVSDTGDRALDSRQQMTSQIT